MLQWVCGILTSMHIWKQAIMSEWAFKLEGEILNCQTVTFNALIDPWNHSVISLCLHGWSLACFPALLPIWMGSITILCSGYNCVAFNPFFKFKNMLDLIEYLFTPVKAYNSIKHEKSCHLEEEDIFVLGSSLLLLIVKSSQSVPKVKHELHLCQRTKWIHYYPLS